MMTRFLDWLDEAAGGLIRVTYLLAGITAVAVYFGAGHLPAMLEDPLNAALPWLLGFSLETHTYLTTRRVRAAWQERNQGALKVQLGVLVGLLAFSAWNQLQYLSLTWSPPTGGALALPTWAAFLVRALIVPAAFMAAAFLAPLAEPVTAQIEAEARATLGDVFKIARKQRRRMLKQAQADGRDMTAALVELVPDPDVRRIIAHAYGAIGAPVAGITHQLAPARSPDGPYSAPYTGAQQVSVVEAAAQPFASEASPAPPEPPSRPPTGPGSPAAVPPVRTRREKAPDIIRLQPDRPARRTAAQANAKGVRTPRRPRTDTASREAEARAAWASGARTIGQMRAVTGMSKTAAASWVRTLKAEHKASAASGKAAQ